MMMHGAEMGTGGGSPDPAAPATAPAWLSLGLASLVDRFPQIDARGGAAGDSEAGGACDVDLVIVGSGYGAAVAARELAGCRPLGDAEGPPLSICILERGSEYLSGAFPSRMADLAGHVRFSTDQQTAARGRRSGLFDLRVGGDVVALVANGVGGGSLINAGVMLQPDPAVFQAPCWPQALRDGPALQPHFDTVRGWLGAGPPGAPNTVDGTPLGALRKTAAIKRLGHAAQAGAQPGGASVVTGAVPITVALKPGTQSVAGVPLAACIQCGDCATGCNHGAKDSLDLGLLAQACHTDGVDLYTGATVLHIEQPATGVGWVVVLQHTDDKLRLRQGAPFRLRARRVILAAGTLGSTEILLRSRQHGLALSPQLGHRLSANGDLIASVHGLDAAVNAVADEDLPANARQVGPTITAMVDARHGASGFVLQDLAVPGPMRQAFAELFTTASVLHRLNQRDGSRHAAADADACAVDPALIACSMPVAMIGHDDATGRLELLSARNGASPLPRPGGAAAAADWAAEGDGALRIVWPGLKADSRWPAQHDALAGWLKTSQLGGRVLPNPAWQLLPDSLQKSLAVPRGPMISVHPLGGCTMGDDVQGGVVNHLGQVFSAAQPAGLHDGLVVLDGSIVPGSLGINPALTIAALAHRAAPGLRQAWGLAAPQPHTAPLGPRPVFRTVPIQPAAVAPTCVELVERMRGQAQLADGQTACIELTLFSEPTALRGLMQPAPQRELTLDGQRSKLRVFIGEPDPWTGDLKPGNLLLTAGLSGRLAIFQHEPSQPLPRTAVALLDWAVNRGLRDTWQSFADQPFDLQTLGEKVELALDSLALASRAGAVRRLDYTLTVHGAKEGLASLFPDGTLLTGEKRLHYGRAASPLRQLMDMRLTRCPALAMGEVPLLSLHLPFLAEQAVPLMRVVGQQDQPTALADMAAFMAYVARILIDGHLWSFRKPDAASLREPRRLPGVVPGAPPPQVVEIEVARLRQADFAGPAVAIGTVAALPAAEQWADDDASLLPVHIRLTRYCPVDVDLLRPPVLLIHGYSASGTTFAHPAVKPGLMGHLTGQYRRDVWVLDLRSSCGMPTAEHGWAFEDMGCEDIPVAVAHVCAATGFEQVDIVAHCMGVAMLFMGLLGQNHFDDKQLLLPRLGRFERLRHQLWDRDLVHWQGEDQANLPKPGDPVRGRSRIRRLVLSQVGPAVLLTPANIARAYLMRYGRQFLRGANYQFRTTGEPGLADQLLDRVLTAMPYPPGEFRLENPIWPLGQRLPWVGVRHRIDALFGRVFNLANMDADTLNHIDDFFGPFCVDTVSQVMHFARYGKVTDRSGFSRFVDQTRMRQRLTFPMLSLHAPQNGLADVATQALMEAVIKPNTARPGLLRTHRLTPYSPTPYSLTPPTLGHQDSLIGNTKVTGPVFDLISTFLQQACAQGVDHA